MAFVVHGQSIADVRIDCLKGQPALGFGRLLVDVELLVHERRQAEKPLLVEFGGEILVRDQQETLHHVGRLRPTQAPVAVEVSGQSAIVELEVELDSNRLSALEKLRVGEEVNLELTIRGRLQVGRESHLVASTETHRMSRADWSGILDQLSV